MNKGLWHGRFILLCGAMQPFFLSTNSSTTKTLNRTVKALRSVNQREAAVNLSLLLHSEYARSLIIQLIPHFIIMYYVQYTLYLKSSRRNSILRAVD